MDELMTSEQRDIKARAREVAEKYVRPQAPNWIVRPLSTRIMRK